MIHAGGWAGHDANAQRILADIPGKVFLQRGWRVVSIDYDEGTSGLGDVLNRAKAELTRATGDGPLCLYGESAGAHLALVAASRLGAIDCVISLGAPTDLPLYVDEGAAPGANLQVQIIADRIKRFFGTTLDQMAPWNPVGLARSMHADVLLLREGDDIYVSALHAERFQVARRTTQYTVLEAGDAADPSTLFVHGTISEAGRRTYAATVGAFADRAVSNRAADRAGVRTGCSHVTRSVRNIGVPALLSALRCLARKDRAALAGSRGSWRHTRIRVRGEVTAARLWASLRTKVAGRKALRATVRRRAKLSVQTSDRSRVTLAPRR